MTLYIEVNVAGNGAHTSVAAFIPIRHWLHFTCPTANRGSREDADQITAYLTRQLANSHFTHTPVISVTTDETEI